jgi:hypothetical protein
MGDMRPRSGILVGLAAAVGAFAAAAMMSAATAPTARADDFTDLINDLNIDYSAGQTAFTTAYTDFSSDQLVPGIAELFGGVDDYTLSTENTLLVATAEVLQGDAVSSTWEWGYSVPASYADAVNVAELYFTNAVADLPIAANDFSTGDYVFGTVNGLLALEYSSIIPLQELLVGAAVSF